MTTTDHLITYNVYNLRLLCCCDTSVGRTEAELTRHLLDVGRNEGRQEGYAIDYNEGYDDAVAATKGEPVAADDPRIKPGARARLEFDSANGVTAHEGVVFRTPDNLLIAAGWLVRSATRVYLLAEAPDPDAEARAALEAAAGDSRTYAGMLDALRALNFDVVKAVAK